MNRYEPALRFWRMKRSHLGRRNQEKGGPIPIESGSPLQTITGTEETVIRPGTFSSKAKGRVTSSNRARTGRIRV